ncbi:MAG: hypothetical protein ABIZ56_00620 [Chthoniobacteraceae bacterium]
MKHRPLFLIVALLASVVVIWLSNRALVPPAPSDAASSSAPAVSSPPAVIPGAKPPPAEPAAPGIHTAPDAIASQTPSAPGTALPATSKPMIAGVPPDPADAPATPAPTTPEPSGNFTEADARAHLEGVRMMLQEFRNSLGENPVGTNSAIMAAINGNNLKQARIGPPQGQKLNEEGELIDGWGTPYFFHQLSKNEMEIRSAGRDRKMWSGDDIVVK